MPKYESIRYLISRLGGIMRHLDLFSGIGGFALAASRVWQDHEVVAFCEREPFCQKVLTKHWPKAPIHDDIKTFKGDGIEADILTGGFPCQPWSIAGKQKGTKDDRHLWPEMFRIIQEVRPRWVIGENVARFAKLGLDSALSDLENEGYTCQAFIIPACAVNAPHRRDRVWIVAHSPGLRLQGRCDVENEQTEAIRLQVAGPGERGGDGPFTNPTRELPHWRGKRGWRGDESANIGKTSSYEKIWRENWITQPPLRPRNDGVSNRVARLRALGNAIVPQVAHVIFEAIKIAEGEKPKE